MKVSGGVVERSRLLANITDELDIIKNEMEERGSSMTDGSPLVNIRKSLARMKSEISGMDVRIGKSFIYSTYFSLFLMENLIFLIFINFFVIHRSD